jgi:hypothetical protein
MITATPAAGERQHDGTTFFYDRRFCLLKCSLITDVIYQNNTANQHHSSNHHRIASRWLPPHTSCCRGPQPDFSGWLHFMDVMKNAGKELPEAFK